MLPLVMTKDWVGSLAATSLRFMTSSTRLWILRQLVMAYILYQAGVCFVRQYRQQQNFFPD